MSPPGLILNVEFLPPIGASAILFLSSLPRVTKGPVPAILAATAVGSVAYYGNRVMALRKH